MENNKTCSQCGTSNDKDASFCVNCGMRLNENNTVANNKNGISQNETGNQTITTNTNDLEEGNKLGKISLILCFAASIILTSISMWLPYSIRNFLSTIGGLCPLAGIVIMIVGRIKYPTNKLLKIAMWIIIASIVIGLILLVIILAWCSATCSNMQGCD